MGMPSISISFTETGSTAISRGERGIIAMILKDAIPAKNPVVCKTESDVPVSLSEASKEQIALAFKGYEYSPLLVMIYVIAADAKDYSAALNYFKTVKFDYLVAPSAETDKQTTAIVNYVKSERGSGKLIKAVLPNTTADCEGIVNFATEKVIAGSKTYTTEQYCSRIAGIIAGTPLYMSCTYAPLPELTDCSRLTRAEMDTAVDAGKMIVWFDGEKVKTARGVNSLTTLTAAKNSQFQKIKIVDTMDMIENDIKRTAEDNYLGRYANTYDNKCLLLSAIGNYFEKVKQDNILSGYSIEIDVDANRAYLKDKGKDVDAMSDDDIKTANMGSSVFLKATIQILDAIEDIVLPITI